MTLRDETSVAQPTVAAGRGPGPRLMIAALVAWPILFAAAFVAFSGRYGFNATDDEFTFAGSYRLIHHQVPHLDFVSARPVGSSILHIVDVGVGQIFGGRVFIVGRLDSMLEVIATATALLALVTRVPYREWGRRPWPGLGLIALACAAAVVDVHVFPLTPWHTIDGMTCTAVGWYLVDTGIRRAGTNRIRLGLLVVSYALICKQSFFPAVLVALAMLAWHPALRERTNRRDWGANILALVAFPLVYAVAVSAAGGFTDMMRQLTASQVVWGSDLFTAWRADKHHPIELVVFVVFIAAVAVWAWNRRQDGNKQLDVLMRLIATVLVIARVFRGGLVLGNGKTLVDPSTAVFWMTIVVVAAEIAVTRRWRQPVLLVVALGWMVSLSWGYAYPALVGGSLAATALVLLWRGAPIREVFTAPVPAWVGAVASVVALAIVFQVVNNDRARHEYRDRAQKQLTVSAGKIAPAFSGIRTSKQTLAYLEQIKSCVAAHPAANTAILPDNPAIYLALKLHNPFPVDWMARSELVANSQDRIRDLATKLSAHGDYLVLFETVPAASSSRAVPANATLGTPIHDETPPLLTDVRDALHGTPITCGSFVGVYAP